MPMIRYQNVKLSRNTMAMIATANKIIDEYSAQGFDLTLRQLFYQFVARGFIGNTMKSYKILGDAVNSGRLAGLIDWDRIADRTRHLRASSHWATPAGIVEFAAASFRLDLWAGQPLRKEVWIEKDALVGILESICPVLDVAYFSSHGYCSQSEMWAAAQRHLRFERDGQPVTVLHLGDHDPSGIDMTRDIADRLAMFGTATTVKRIALTMEQITDQHPPPNPAKMTDSRAADYVSKYGDESWELDALEPKYLVALITGHVIEGRDDAMYARRQAEQAKGRKLLAACAKDWRHVSADLKRRGKLD